MPTGISCCFCCCAAGWSVGEIYLGCFLETADRAMPHSAGSVTSPTDCLIKCNQAGYRFAGVQSGQQCWCSNGDFDKHGPRADKDCATQCSKAKVPCGGSWRNSVYSNAAPVHFHDHYTYLGCFTDKADDKDLTGLSGTMNHPRECFKMCADRHYVFAG
eukprot:GHVU01165097.1.p1 GENE.GHVU01165097.1~~GHVU01165097.1.p1  ORF type:complete len:159 (-),score=10.32 GHVU01165097.1:26-502(-)